MANPIKHQTIKAFCGGCGESVTKYAVLNNGKRVKFDLTANLKFYEPGKDYEYLGEGVIYSLGNQRVRSAIKRHFWRKKNGSSNPKTE